MTEKIDNIISIAETAAKEAGSIIMNLFNKADVKEKGISNLVTEADIKSEERIRTIILENFPTHSILGEEGGGDLDINCPNLWVLDPLDGTNNYAHGFPFFSVSIAYAEMGEVKAGLVFDPVRGEIFTAKAGLGAFLNGRRITVSEKPLDAALISTGFYYDRGEIMRRTLRAIEKLIENNIHGIRRTGSAAIDCCYVASGRLEGYFEYALSPWDFAAGMLIIREAGGVCHDASGVQLNLESGNIAVSNGVCTDKLLEIIKGDL